MTYNNLRAYTNPKNMIGMLVTGCHVSDHAYMYDKKIHNKLQK